MKWKLWCSNALHCRCVNLQKQLSSIAFIGLNENNHARCAPHFTDFSIAHIFVCVCVRARGCAPYKKCTRVQCNLMVERSNGPCLSACFFASVKIKAVQSVPLDNILSNRIETDRILNIHQHSFNESRCTNISDLKLYTKHKVNLKMDSFLELFHLLHFPISWKIICSSNTDYTLYILCAWKVQSLQFLMPFVEWRLS